MRSTAPLASIFSIVVVVVHLALSEMEPKVGLVLSVTFAVDARKALQIYLQCGECRIL